MATSTTFSKPINDELSTIKSAITELDTDKYEKPSGGVPSSDMTSAVQTSLGKADSAYQKPQNGIPASDLASGVIPTVHNVPAGGATGQVLAKTSGTDYALEWANPVNPSDAQAETYISAWLDDHPEATTTVEDGSITKAKLHSTLADDIDGKAPAILGTTTTEKYSNTKTTEKKVSVVGNSFEHTSVKLFDKAQFTVDTWRSASSNGVASSDNNELLKLNGTATANISNLWTMTANNAVTIPSALKGKTVKIRIVSDKAVTVNAYSQSDTMYFRVYLRKEGTTGDGRSVKAVAVGTKSNEYIDVSDTFDINSDDDILYVIVRYIGSGSSFSNVNFHVAVYPSDVSIYDTETTIETGESEQFDIPSGYSVVDSGVHKNALIGVLDTKTYVDEHIPDDVVTTSYLEEYNPTEENLKYITPEMFQAVGDGSTDDTTALQNCINYAITNNKPVRAFGSYKATSPISIVGDSLNIYIHNLVYTGADAAVIMTGDYNYIHIDRLYAYGSTGAGFRLTTTADKHATYNEIHLGSVYAYTNGIEYINNYGLSAEGNKHLYYNRLYVQQLYSRTQNCILLSATNQLAENSFWGKHISNNSGYFVYTSGKGQDSTNRFYEFCIESASKNGVYGSVSLINCRTGECEGRKQPSTMDEGDIFVLYGLPGARAINTGVNYIALNVAGCDTYADRLQVVKDRYEAGSSSALSIDAGFPSTMKKCVVSEDSNVSSYISGDTYNTDYTPKGTLIAYLNCKGFIPNCEWYKEIDVAEYHTWTTDHCFPTFFDISANTTIYLDDSYCPVGIKEFKVRQTASAKAQIYDHNNNLIFDGANLSDGTYIIRCEMSVTEPVTLSTTKGNITISSARMRGIYLGFNDDWTVEKPNYV